MLSILNLKMFCASWFIVVWPQLLLDLSCRLLISPHKLIDLTVHIIFTSILLITLSADQLWREIPADWAMRLRAFRESLTLLRNLGQRCDNVVALPRQLRIKLLTFWFINVKNLEILTINHLETQGLYNLFSLYFKR